MSLLPEDRDLVLWVLNKSHPSLEHSTGEDVHGHYVIKLPLDQVRALALLVEDQMSSIEEDISRCISDSSSLVLDRHHDTLDSILASLNTAKPLVSEPSSALSVLPGDCLHPA